MNRTIKDATVKRYHYESHDQLVRHLADFVAAYNFARRLKTLGGLTPYEFVCSLPEGCHLMGIARSTFYDLPTAVHDDTAIVEAIAAICDEFEFYGWRRVRAGLRHRGMIVNHKKVRRLMREHDLQPRRRRRHVATTDSNHDQPIYPNRTRELTVDVPNQLWVADITYVAIHESFAYVAVILDAWSRRAVGYAISRSIDVRLTFARA